MKFLVDNQLPTAVARWLSQRGYDALHVLDTGMAQVDDRLLWQTAATEGRIMVSKDEDFFLLATRPLETGRLLWLRIGNCRKQQLLHSLEQAWPAIEAAFASGERIVECRN